MPFIEAMDVAYAKADLALCRAGATTVAELDGLRQSRDFGAVSLRDLRSSARQRSGTSGTGRRGDDFRSGFNGKILVEKLRGYLSNRGRITRMAARRAVGRPDAAARIVDECYALARA